MSVELDASELGEFSARLGRQPPRVARQVRAVVERGGLELKRRMQSEASGSARLKGVPRSISYTVASGADNVSVEVGPEVGRAQGSLAWIGYEGTATSGPVFPDPQAALDDEALVLERHLQEAVEDL